MSFLLKFTLFGLIATSVLFGQRFYLEKVSPPLALENKPSQSVEITRANSKPVESPVTDSLNTLYGMRIDYSMYYNILLDKNTDAPNYGGFTIGGTVAWLIDNIHALGPSLFWTSYSSEGAEFSRPSFAWEARLAFTYKAAYNYSFFSFNYGLHTGPSYFNAQNTPENGSDKSHIFFFIQPEIELEFRLFSDNFGISFPVGYVIHVGGLSGKSLDTSHLSVGLTWRFYILPISKS